MNISLDGVAIIANHENNRVQLVADHGAYFLRCQLERPIAGKEDCSSLASLFCGKCCTLTRASSVADTSPQDLTDPKDSFRKVCLEDTIIACAGFGKDNIVLL